MPDELIGSVPKAIRPYLAIILILSERSECFRKGLSLGFVGLPFDSEGCCDNYRMGFCAGEACAKGVRCN
jgi:hypothetical protein